MDAEPKVDHAHKRFRVDTGNADTSRQSENRAGLKRKLSEQKIVSISSASKKQMESYICRRYEYAIKKINNNNTKRIIYDLFLYCALIQRQIKYI